MPICQYAVVFNTIAKTVLSTNKYNIFKKNDNSNSQRSKVPYSIAKKITFIEESIENEAFSVKIILVIK